MDLRPDSWIAEHSRARELLLAAIEAYQAWLDQHGHVDIKRSLSIYDLQEQVRAERVRVAVTGRDARVRAEAINAIAASARAPLPLPASPDAFRCPLEIRYEPAAASLSLLPMETLRRNQPLAALGRHPGEWLRIEFDVQDRQALGEALARCSEMHEIEPSAAGWAGSLDWLGTGDRSGGLARVPKWRYAILTLPWPALQAGAVLLDLPALDALAIDPEYSTSVIAGADLLALVVRDAQPPGAGEMAAWRALPPELHRSLMCVPGDASSTGLPTQESGTARHVDSAHAAPATTPVRVGTAATDALLREAIAGGPPSQRLERIREELVRLLHASAGELRDKIAACDAELDELSTLADKNRGLARAMLARLERERAAFTLHANGLRAAEASLTQKVQALSGRLQDGVLDALFATSRQEMEASWTTAGLRQSMENFFEVFAAHVNESMDVARNAGEVIDGIYLAFQQSLGLNSLLPPKLTLEPYVEAMQRLRHTTEGFCRDRKHLMTEKSLLIRKFYAGLETEARALFQSARGELEGWFTAALAPIGEHLNAAHRLLERRAENLRMLSEDLSGLQERVHQLNGKRAALQGQIDALARIEGHALRARLRPRQVDGDLADQRADSDSRSAVLSTLP